MKELLVKRLLRLHTSQDRVLELNEILDEVNNDNVSKEIRKIREGGNMEDHAHGHFRCYNLY